MNYGILSTSSIAPRFIAAVREEGSFNVVALSSRTSAKLVINSGTFRHKGTNYVKTALFGASP